LQRQLHIFLPKLEEDGLKRLATASGFQPVRRGQGQAGALSAMSHHLQQSLEESPIVLPPIRNCAPDYFRSPASPVKQDNLHPNLSSSFANPSAMSIPQGGAGPYSPDDYSIPPDEEDEREDGGYQDQEPNHHLIRLELPPYYFNVKTEPPSTNYVRLEPPQRLEDPEPKRRCLSLYNGYGYDSLVNKRFQPL